MRLYLMIVLFSASVSLCLGQQTPSATPTPAPSASPENIKPKDFGSSLRKYEKKDQRDAESKPKNNEPDADEIVRVATKLAVNDILVTEQSGKVITNLKKDDFIVTENGAPQTIEVFSEGENATAPRSVVLIIDIYTMQAPYLKRSIEAAKLLVDKLSPQDKMAIVTTDIKLHVDFTKDKTLLKKILDSLERYTTDSWENFKSGTTGRARNFYDSLKVKQGAMFGTGAEFDTLLAVLNEMFTAEDRRPIIIFQGDGNEIIWLKPDSDAPYPVAQSTRDDSGMRYVGKKAMRNFGFGEVREAIESSRATIFSVVIGMRFLGLTEKEQQTRAKISFENYYRVLGMNEKYLPEMTRRFQRRERELHTAGQTAMFKVAELAGGSTGFVEKPEDAEIVYANIFENIKNRYLIGYYPTNREQGGKRNVTIQVRNHPEYTVIGRKSYFLH